MSIEQVKGNADEAKLQAQKLQDERTQTQSDGSISKTRDDKKYVIVDGPLGLAFTEGLNRLLSKESSVMQAVAADLLTDEESVEDPRIKAPYVYVFNGGDGAMASKEHFDKIMTALRSGKYSEVRVVAEISKDIGDHLDLVTESAKRQGAQLNVTSDMTKVFNIYKGR